MASFAGIEVYGPFDVLLLDLAEEGFYEVAVRIKDRHPHPFFDIIENHHGHGRGLVWPGLPMM